MSRARKICGGIGEDGARCPNFEPCPDHGRKAWVKRDEAPQRLRGRRSTARTAYIIERDEGVCWICGYAGADQADHVIPLAEGGLDHVANLKAAHAKCNANKGQAEAARGRARGRQGQR